MHSKHCKRFRWWLHFICLLFSHVFVWLICFPPISIWTAALVPPPWAGDLSGRMKSNCPVGSHWTAASEMTRWKHTFLQKEMTLTCQLCSEYFFEKHIWLYLFLRQYLFLKGAALLLCFMWQIFGRFVYFWVKCRALELTNSLATRFQGWHEGW